MNKSADKYSEGPNLCTNLAQLRVDVEAVITVNGVAVPKKIQAGDSGTGNRRSSRSNLPAWLAASKAALAASQADHQETQRRISKLQQATRGLSIIDFPEPTENEAAQINGSGCNVNKYGGLAREEGACGGRHQLHRMTLGVIAEVLSFLDPQAVLSYALACKAAEDTLWQDECWGEIFRVRHLTPVVGVPSFSPALSPSVRQSPSTPPPAHEKLRDVNTLEDSAEAMQNHGPSALKGAPQRKAVITHARSLSRALGLFDAAVSDGATTKAVVNGPARTAAAVASLRALVEITANVYDPVGRRAFANVRTGQVLLSIITRQQGSSVLQDLACAVLGNLLCDPENGTAGVEISEQAAECDVLDGSAADKLLGRSRRPAIHALTALCSSTRPSLSSGSAQKLGGDGMRPVENLPGRQASRALINLLLPRYQVSQQLVTRPNKDDNLPRQPAARRCPSLPLMPPPARRETQQPQGEASDSDRSSQEFIPAPAKPGKGGSGVGGAQSVSAAWEEGTTAGGSRPLPARRGGEASRREQGGGEGVRGKNEALPMVAAPVAGGELTQLPSVAPTNKAAETPAHATPMPDGSASTLSQAVPKLACQLPRGQSATAAGRVLASRPMQAIGQATVPLPAASSPKRPITETPGVSPTRAAPHVAAGSNRSPQFISTPAAPLGEHAKHGSGCDSPDAEQSKSLDSLSATRVFRPEEGSTGSDRQHEELWEAFYFYHSGGVKDTFLVTLSFSTTSRGGIFGRGTDKLGNFVIEGAPLDGHAAGHTWFVAKTYTGRGLPDAAGCGWSGGAHVTHTAYLTDGQARDHRLLEPNLRPSLNKSDTSRKGRRDGFWGVWEPVLGCAGDGGGGGGGGGRRVSSMSGPSSVPDGYRTTLSRRGGVFRMVPSQQDE